MDDSAAGTLGDPWPHYRFSDTGSGHSDLWGPLGRGPLTHEVLHGLGARGGNASLVSSRDGTLFVGTQAGRLLAFDRDPGNATHSEGTEPPLRQRWALATIGTGEWGKQAGVHGEKG